MSLETTLRLPGGCGIPGIGAQGRVIGFVVQPSRGPGRLVAIHLDNPGVTVEAEIPHANALPSDSRVSGFCLCVYIQLTQRRHLVFVGHLHANGKPSDRLQH